MDPLPARLFDGRKFLWDGRSYADRVAAETCAEDYRNARFDVRLAEEEGKYFVFTRRIVEQVAEAAS